MGDDRPKRDSMSIEEATVSNMWEIAAIAELERNIIVERIKGGLRRAKAMGKKIGRPGLQMDNERIMNLKTQGLSIRAIAKQVGASPSYVHKALQVPR
jgi:DNA invertase Pin-like site-specific DNA recombinase